MKQFSGKNYPGFKVVFNVVNSTLITKCSLKGLFIWRRDGSVNELTHLPGWFLNCGEKTCLGRRALIILEQ